MCFLLDGIGSVKRHVVAVLASDECCPVAAVVQRLDLHVAESSARCSFLEVSGHLEAGCGDRVVVVCCDGDAGFVVVGPSSPSYIRGVTTSLEQSVGGECGLSRVFI